MKVTGARTDKQPSGSFTVQCWGSVITQHVAEASGDGSEAESLKKVSDPYYLSAG